MGYLALGLIVFSIVSLIYLFSPINPFNGKGPSAGVAGFFCSLLAASIGLIGLIILAVIGFISLLG